ncbi:hypothetical protein MMOR_55780 [Mycolicibacterium moriokaense]|uniref:Uncharacterized protein n=1 Tax=Mycolicibacterium moriokaense TaxID=39691 RepID=A0AAD1HFY0_9MYCO|nr:hypothetical protein MMOR_55780 [Mycolicibacterium moriokaense]
MVGAVNGRWDLKDAVERRPDVEGGPDMPELPSRVSPENRTDEPLSSGRVDESITSNQFRDRSRVIREDFTRAVYHDMMVKIQGLQTACNRQASH